MAHEEIRAVAFDAVGTLIHPEPAAAEVYADVGRRFGSRLEVAAIRRRFHAAFAEQEAIDQRNRLTTSEDRERRRWQEIVARVLDDVHDGASCFAELYAHFSRPTAWRCEDDAATVLERLRDEGYVLAIASNYDHRLRIVIAGLEPLASMSPIVISSEIGWRKPALQFFTHLADTLGLPPSTILYVGDDWDNDYEAARRAGLRVLLFDPLAKRLDIGAARVGNLRELAGAIER